MPWKIVNRAGRICVVKKDGGEVVKCHQTRQAAVAHMRALYANVPDAADKK